MIGSRIPRFILYTTVLGTVVAAIMLSMFYGQYRWLAKEIMSTSYEEHRTQLEASFERRTTAELHSIADTLPYDIDASDANTVASILDRALATNPTLAGLQLAMTSGTSWSSGNHPDFSNVTGATWLDEHLLMSYPVIRDTQEVGQIFGSFQLTSLHADLVSFTEEVQTKEDESRRVSYLWIGGGTIAMLLLCGVVVWSISHGQTKRIRQLKAQAEKFRDADFGDPLPAARGDELGALADVFNDMRDKLRKTTHSRNYVDSILSGMNEAIIVTSEDGQIIGINTATTHLLGYEEESSRAPRSTSSLTTKKSRSLTMRRLVCRTRRSSRASLVSLFPCPTPAR